MSTDTRQPESHRGARWRAVDRGLGVPSTLLAAIPLFCLARWCFACAIGSFAGLHI
jgi:hypothetical protein